MRSARTEHLSPEEFADRFPGGHRTMFRFETANCYTEPTEEYALERFRAGLPADPEWMDGWRELLAGRDASRVHVVTEPLNRYLVFELTCGYPLSAGAGEQIRILPRRDAARLRLASGQDFWLFDNRVVGWMHYDPAGQLESVTVTDSKWAAFWCRRIRDRAWRAATPLGEYLDRAGLTVDAGIREVTAEGVQHG